MRGGLALFLPLLLAASQLALCAQEPKANAKIVLDLAKESAEGKDVAKKAAALTRRFGTAAAAMRVYNARNQNGVGYGPKGIRIERRLIDIEEDGLPAATLQAEAAELTRVAHVNLVMAEVLRGYAPAKPFLGRGKKEWDRDLDAMKAASAELAKAVKADDAKAARDAVAKINKACNSCHDGAK